MAAPEVFDVIDTLYPLPSSVDVITGVSTFETVMDCVATLLAVMPLFVAYAFTVFVPVRLNGPE